jgi:hypothetical protein
MHKNLIAFSMLCCTSLAHAGMCTREFAPVCGQLQQHIQTFGNHCTMKDAGARWVSDGECPAAHSTAPAKDITLTVAAHAVACMGTAPMRCLQVKEEGALNWTNFYSPIEGFTFTPGMHYKLLVRATPIDAPPPTWQTCAMNWCVCCG